MITKHLFLAILWACPLLLNSQLQGQEKTDSLLTVFEDQKRDTLKVNTLHALFDQYMYVDWGKALEYATKEFELSKEIEYEKGKGKGHLHMGMAYYFLDNIDSTRSKFDSAISIFESIQDYFLLATANRNYAIIEYEKGNYDKALGILDNSINLFKNKMNDSIGLGISYETKSKIYVSKGNYKLALQNALNCLKILEKVNDDFHYANALYNIGYVEFFNKNFDKSIEYNTKALKIYRSKNKTWWAAQALNDLGNNYYHKENYEKAEESLNLAIELANEVDAKWITCSALGAIGKIKIAQERFEEAEILFDRSLAIANEQDLKMKIVEGLNHKGEVNLKKKKYQNAISYLNKSMYVADSIGAKDQLKTAYGLRAEGFSALGDYESAFKDNTKLISLNDSIFNETKQQQIEELKTIYQTEKKEAEIALQEEEIKTLGQEVEISNLKKGLYAGGMTSALALSGLLIFGFRQRIKKNKIAREKQEEIYRQEIAHKKKELTSQTLHLVQKNTFIQELMDNLENVKNSPEKFKTEFRRIVMLLKKENASDKDWEIFKTYFADVHNDFDQKLKTFYADISEKEIRLAAFLRMNLTTKEIAATMNVLPDSILKSKYRLKKKLNLDRQTDLNQFLNSL